MSNLVPFSDYLEVNPARYIPNGLNITSTVSFVPMADVSESGHWFGNQVRRLNEVLSGFTNFKNNDVLVAKITPCFENGKGAFVVDLENGVGFGSTEFHVLRAKQGTCARFIFHVTQWPQFRLSSERFMTGSAGQKRVQTLAFSQFEIADFGEDEQKNIATILDTLDTQIRETEVIIAKLQQVKQGLLHDLLTRGIDENGQLRPPYEQAPELYKESPLGWIPKEWSTSALIDLSEIKSGSTPSRELFERYFGDGSYLWVKTLDLNEGFINETSEFITDKALSETSCILFPEKTVLIAMYGGWEQIGRTAILGKSAATNQAISALQFESKVMPEFALRAIQFGRHRWASIAASTRKDPNITKNDIEDFLVSFPVDCCEQRLICQKYEAMIGRIKKEEERVKKLKKQKTGLMDDLLTGRVRVTEQIEQAQQAS